MIIGQVLQNLVTAYDRLGDKRTGSVVETAMCDWLAQELSDRGAGVQLQRYSIQHWREQLEVTVDGRAVDAITVPFTGVGTATVRRPQVRELTLLGGMIPVDLDDALGEAIGELPVLSTAGPGGRLVAMNRPVAAPAGPPVVLVSANDAEAVREAGVVSCTTTVAVGESTNVVARLGPDDGRAPIVVVSPLSGWFRCAAERGCGLAITIELARRLAAERPVLVLAATGHEYEYAGADAFLAGLDTTPGAVVHVGASLAALNRDGQASALAPTRFAMFDGQGLPSPDETAEAIDAALAGAGLGRLDMPVWPGEGQAWRRFGVPVLSATGAFERFHTPQDTGPLVTSPEALAQVYGAIGVAVDVLIRSLPEI